MIREQWVVYVIHSRGERKFWSKVGIGFDNPDGSIELVLESLPVDGKLHIRRNCTQAP